MTETAGLDAEMATTALYTKRIFSIVQREEGGGSDERFSHESLQKLKKSDSKVVSPCSLNIRRSFNKSRTFDEFFRSPMIYARYTERVEISVLERLLFSLLFHWEEKRRQFVGVVKSGSGKRRSVCSSSRLASPLFGGENGEEARVFRFIFSPSYYSIVRWQHAKSRFNRVQTGLGYRGCTLGTTEF